MDDLILVFFGGYQVIGYVIAIIGVLGCDVGDDCVESGLIFQGFYVPAVSGFSIWNALCVGEVGG